MRLPLAPVAIAKGIHVVDYKGVEPLVTSFLIGLLSYSAEVTQTHATSRSHQSSSAKPGYRIPRARLLAITLAAFW